MKNGGQKERGTEEEGGNIDEGENKPEKRQLKRGGEATRNEVGQ
jgi:hypothetical protein